MEMPASLLFSAKFSQVCESYVFITNVFVCVPLLCARNSLRFRKQKLNHQKAVLRCQQKTINGAGGVAVGGGMMDSVPALIQGLNGRQPGANANEDENGVFYDELISYAPQFRAPNHPPAYEVHSRV